MSAPRIAGPRRALRLWLRLWARLGLAALAVMSALALLGAAGWSVAVRAGEFPRERLAPSSAASVVVLDAQGEVLRETASSSGGRERWVALGDISPWLVAATVVSEDRRFREHHGVDPVGVARALWLDLAARRFAFGGSTLTMQLVRLLDAAPAGSGGPPRGIRRKVRDAVLAGRLERVASKDEILEQYLNRVYYGNGAWGAESAARLYFGKPAAALALGEATLLATVPRGPRAYDPWSQLDAALARRRHILGLMVRAGAITDEERRLAERTPLPIGRHRAPQRAHHFVDWILSRLPGGSPPPGQGVTVRTTLDGPLQNALEVALDRHLQELGGRHVSEAGVLVLRHQDGAVLGMVGSRDYFDPAGGASNVTTVRRRPGSTLKPFVYGLALERGDSPATVALDLILPREAHETWTADVRQHGPARYRESLAGSYNLAAVHTLARVGVSSLVERLRQAGLTTLDRDHAAHEGGRRGYDLSLAIGEAEVRLIELAAAYASFGHGGRAIVPRPIASIARPGVALPEESFATDGPRVFSPRIAWLIWHMLSDPDARRPMFGGRAPMVLPFPVALKTGTTRAYTDNLAFGVTAEYTVAAWAGNFDGTPTDGVMAMRGAAPLVRAALVAVAARFGDPSAPPRPEGADGLVAAAICPLSGERPGPSCPAHKSELFLAGTVPERECSWHVHACGRARVRWPAEVRPWARFHHLDDSATCAALDPSADERLRIVAPVEGARYQLDPHRPLTAQRPPLRALPAGAAVTWSLDGQRPERFVPSPGQHTVSARLGAREQRVTISFE